MRREQLTEKILDIKRTKNTWRSRGRRMRSRANLTERIASTHDPVTNTDRSV